MKNEELGLGFDSLTPGFKNSKQQMSNCQTRVGNLEIGKRKVEKGMEKHGRRNEKMEKGRVEIGSVGCGVSWKERWLETVLDGSQTEKKMSENWKREARNGKMVEGGNE